MSEWQRSDADRFLRVFGARLRERREARGWTQAELAERAGLHRTFVGAVERGRNGLNVALLPALARALLIEPAELVPGWESFTERNSNPRHQQAMRSLRELLDGEAAGLPPLTPEAREHIEGLERELAARRSQAG